MIYFVRHGESEANAQGILAGQRDSPMTERGILQVQDLAQSIRSGSISLDVIITTSLSRAYESARMIAEANGYPVENIVVLDSLLEKYAGTFEGRPVAEMFAASEDDMSRAGGETFAEFFERVRQASKQVTARATGTTLVVGHAEFYRAAQCIQLGWGPERIHDTERPPNAQLLEYPLA